MVNVCGVIVGFFVFGDFIVFKIIRWVNNEICKNFMSCILFYGIKIIWDMM